MVLGIQPRAFTFVGRNATLSILGIPVIATDLVFKELYWKKATNVNVDNRVPLLPKS